MLSPSPGVLAPRLRTLDFVQRSFLQNIVPVASKLSVNLPQDTLVLLLRRPLGGRSTFVDSSSVNQIMEARATVDRSRSVCWFAMVFARGDESPCTMCGRRRTVRWG